jgi:hypothetical protein
MIAVDGHVHFHRLSQIAPTLRAAADNFSHFTGRRSGCAGVLLLTQAAQERVFERLCDRRRIEDWSFDEVPHEPQSVVATAADGRWIGIVNGRQVRSEDGLEVLAIGTCAEFADGAPFEALVERVEQSGAVTVIPWGFGKWLGRRGARVSAVLAGSDRRDVSFGDNGGRTVWLPEPRILRSARSCGFRIIPGSDPFPFGRDYRRVGRFGFELDVTPSRFELWGQLRPLLVGDAPSPRCYGSRLGLGQFVVNNVGIQLVRRLGWGMS